MLVKCDNCKKFFKTFLCFIKDNKSKCCSHECSKSFKLKRLIKKLPSGCWQYMGKIYSTGYGNHRSVYERLKKVKIKNGLYLDHLCRNRSCVNPDHLEPVTHAENCRRGKQAKLNKESVKDIIVLRAMGFKQVALAKMYDVNQGNISKIINGLKWA